MLIAGQGAARDAKLAQDPNRVEFRDKFNEPRQGKGPERFAADAIETQDGHTPQSPCPQTLTAAVGADKDHPADRPEIQRRLHLHSVGPGVRDVVKHHTCARERI